MTLRGLGAGTVLTLGLSILGCAMSAGDSGRALIEAPESTAQEALRYAYSYVEEDTEYVYGGQDPVRSIGIDCSGLVVNCYGYAVEGTPYSLPFQDAAVIDFFKDWTRGTVSPRPGDLMFMGDDPSAPSHMGLFVKEAEGRVHFIDSTYKPEEGINGVTERSYESDDARILSFGLLLLRE